MTMDKQEFLTHLVKWKETYELSFELADVVFTLLDTLIDYCKEHNVPLYQEEGTWSLVRKARSIFKQIEQVNESRKLPHFLFDDREPEELPESLPTRNKSLSYST